MLEPSKQLRHLAHGVAHISAQPSGDDPFEVAGNSTPGDVGQAMQARMGEEGFQATQIAAMDTEQKLRDRGIEFRYKAVHAEAQFIEDDGAGQRIAIGM